MAESTGDVLHFLLSQGSTADREMLVLPIADSQLPVSKMRGSTSSKADVVEVGRNVCQRL